MGKTFKTAFKRIIECLLVFISVGTLYFIIECIYKQEMSHWTMFCLSGFVGVIAMLLNDKFTYEMDFLLQVFICTVVTTVLEYIVGIIWNADYSIWDYRGLLIHLNGQISLLFSCIWAVLFSILIPILDYVEWKVFKYKIYTPPYYKIFGKTVFRFK
jgi:uncharacterized membrane protein